MVLCPLTGVALVHSGCSGMSGIPVQSLRGIFSQAHAVSDVISFSLSLSHLVTIQTQFDTL